MYQKYFKLTLTVILLAFFIAGCNQSTNQRTDENFDKSDVNSGKHFKSVQNVKKLFYNVPSPLEMAKILNDAGAKFNPELLNKIENKQKYLTGSKLALNFGVYASDLSFTRLMERIQESVKYLAVIRKISDEIGIPQDKGTTAVNRIEQNIENKDSIIQIISDLYYFADSYLKDNERADAAAMIVLGGWVEAIYIASNIIDEIKPDKQIMNCIAEQKFSFTNLINLINEYKANKDLNKYIPDLLKLKNVYDQIEITYIKNSVETDKHNKTTTIKNKSQITVTIEQIKEIKKITGNIRKDIIM